MAAGPVWANLQRQSRGISCPILGTYESTDGGRRAGPSGRSVAMSSNFVSDGTAFLTCGPQVFVSTDRAQSYTEVTPVPDGFVADLYPAPVFDGSG